MGAMVIDRNETRPCALEQLRAFPQGDKDGGKGVYPINAVDRVTQGEIVATCDRLSEAYLVPVIKAILEGFPFTISGFHTDNGSDYLNHPIAGLDKTRPLPKRYKEN